ncbi:MAG: hypothetical protein AAB660_02655 [Patescibacteria group bacterium]
MKSKAIALVFVFSLPFVASATPSVDLRVNGSDEPAQMISGVKVNLSWTVSGASQCILSELQSDGSYFTKNYLTLGIGESQGLDTATTPAGYPTYSYTIYCRDDNKNWSNDKVRMSVYTETERQQRIQALKTEIDELTRLLKKLSSATN